MIFNFWLHARSPGGGLENMKQIKSPGPPRDASQTAAYIEPLAKELRQLAAASNLGFLAYLLAMVEDEAAATAKRLAKTTED